MLAIYKRNGRYGAVAKSNYVGLRSREPVYTSIRELIMSYFKDFYNLDGLFSLRLLSPEVIADLSPIDPISYKAGMSITNLDGVYKPGTSPEKDFGL